MRLLHLLDACDQHAVDNGTDGEEKRKGDEERSDRIDPQASRQLEREERAEHDERAVGDVDDAHDPHDQAETERRDRIDETEENAVGKDAL